MNDELLARCRSFIDEQSCGEWDDKAINEDAAKLYEFVQREAASALRLAAQSPEPVAWIDFADNGNVRLWTHKKARMSAEEAEGRKMTPVYTAPPRSASDGALLEAAAKIASSYDGVNFPPAHRHANIIAQAIRALAASEATKSDGGEERPASNPLSEVTHRPSDPKTSPELLALLERAKSHVMTPEDVYEQRRSFVRGMCPSDRDYTEWCADVDRIIPPLAGPSDTRPADVTVTPRVIDNDRDEIVVTLNGNELRGWSYSTEQERRVKMLCAREFVEGFHAGRQP